MGGINAAHRIFLIISIITLISQISVANKINISKGWAHDPAVIQRASDGKYFKFNTGAGLHYASANSLNGPWTIVGDVLPQGSSINNAGSKDPWVSRLE